VIVVDTNVIAYVFLKGEHTACAEALIERDREWAAPLLWRSEMRNILATYVRREALDLGSARKIAALAEGLMRGREYAVRSDAVLAAAASSGCTAYDCEFAVLAEELRVPLVTCDAKLLRAFPSIARPLAEEAAPAL
jgi:predicted nucleic acid-binding protein